MDLCQECQACVYACPQGAIEPVGELAPVVEGEVVTPRREIVVQPAAGVPSRSTPRLWFPGLSAALAYVGREILPTVVTSLVGGLETRSSFHCFGCAASGGCCVVERRTGWWAQATLALGATTLRPLP